MLAVVCSAWLTKGEEDRSCSVLTQCGAQYKWQLTCIRKLQSPGKSLSAGKNEAVYLEKSIMMQTQSCELKDPRMLLEEGIT